MKDKKIKLISFGTKYKNRPFANIIYDATGLANPHSKYPNKTGLDKEVRYFVINDANTLYFIANIFSNIHGIFINNNIDSLIVSVSCIGGKHRSVVIVEELARRLREHGYIVEIEHRDIDK